ncbi:hypothetical protein [Microbacterium sp. 77mftsu3.1]|uniref:hypothetical protein n=1 Tax=Microbacterium sp. 77mftsu3.1 TaxID=1761802 RepID=UPI00037EF75E|nr:hypothetical protein [Microbacterium sp. 77mftsu3.1]SDG21448.1 hypothetical protein SAMN04488590_0205 [Microbacterium sp. 77mftsu3.1]
MGIVFAAPAVQPDPREVAEGRFMSWTGVNGETFVLSYGTFPSMLPGVQGLHMPQMDVRSSSSPLVHGEDLRSYHIPSRRVFWPLMFQARSASEWRTQHAAFFDSFHPIVPGTWTVGEGDDARTLALVGVFDGNHVFQVDPFLTGYANIGLELSAPRPLWRGQAVRQTFLGAEAGVDFIPDEPGDVYYLSSDSSFALANIDNPGNEPAYLTWTVNGPLTSIQLGVDGAIIEVAIPVPEGSALTIDTDPAAQFATLDGDDVTAELGFQLFGPVPAGGTSPLVIQAEGTGSVVAELTPLYWRAY